MKKLSYILSILIILLLLGGCKKYEEGPYLSLRNKEKRLCREWVLKKFVVDNKEIQIDKENIWEFKEDNSFSKTIIYEDKSVDEGNEWYFYDDKIIKIPANFYRFYNSIDSLGNLIVDSMTGEYIVDTVTTEAYKYYIIFKLKSNELVLETTHNPTPDDIVLLRYEFINKE